MLEAIGQISRKTKNIAAARRWYEEILGLRHLYSFATLSFFDLGGVRLFLSEGEADDSILYFRVEDIAASVEALTRRGVIFTHPPHMIHRHDDGTEEWMAFFQDLDGKAMALMAQTRRHPA
jgi:catechol 2,3-dioxygenase-like lactoylglutathione lyase family enzyme